METYPMMGFHHIENSERIKALSLSWILYFLPKFAVALLMRSESEEEKFRTGGFSMQNFTDKAHKLRHWQFSDRCA